LTAGAELPPIGLGQPTSSQLSNRKKDIFNRVDTVENMRDIDRLITKSEKSEIPQPVLFDDNNVMDIGDLEEKLQQVEDYHKINNISYTREMEAARKDLMTTIDRKKFKFPPVKGGSRFSRKFKKI